jgi:YVTN family beta-propeller protein
VLLTPDGTRAYVTNFYTGKVSAIDTTTNSVTTTTISVGATPYTVAFSPDGSLAYRDRLGQQRRVGDRYRDQHCHHHQLQQWQRVGDLHCPDRTVALPLSS